MICTHTLCGFLYTENSERFKQRIIITYLKQQFLSGFQRIISCVYVHLHTYTMLYTHMRIYVKIYKYIHIYTVYTVYNAYIYIPYIIHTYIAIHDDTNIHTRTSMCNIIMYFACSSSRYTTIIKGSGEGFSNSTSRQMFGDMSISVYFARSSSYQTTKMSKKDFETRPKLRPVSLSTEESGKNNNHCAHQTTFCHVDPASPVHVHVHVCI